MTEGVAEGHNLLIDKKTLQQLKERCEEFDNGVKVKIDHFCGFEGIIGTLQNFRIKGKKLLGDLHLLKNHKATGLVLEMAEDMPDMFGLSASFAGVDEELNGLMFARVDEVFSIDLVDRPAANPTGLFEAPSVDTSGCSNTEQTFQTSTQPKNNMSDSNTETAPTTQELSAKIDKLANAFESVLDKLPKPEKEITDETKLSEVSVGELKNLINGQVSEQATALGWKPGQTPAPAEGQAPATGVTNQPTDGQAPQGGNDNTPKSFEAVVQHLIAGGMEKPKAVEFAIGQPENAELYKAWKARGGQAHF